MSYPLLGNPKVSFFDSSGSPLASGTLAVLDPADDNNKASFPTADNADAGTNANVNPIELDARGEPPNGLFGQDDETYKLVLKDSSGDPIWTVDDVRCPSREPHYGETPQTLTNAGAVSLTTPVTHVVTTTASALTLADGTEGQRKFIIMKTDGGDATLTPSNLGNGTTIIFDDVGDSANLIFVNASWHWIGGTATLTGKSNLSTKFKLADQTVTSNDTLADDTHLKDWVLRPNTFYELRGFLKVNTGASATPDFKFAFAVDNAFVEDFRAVMNHSSSSITGISGSLTASSTLQIVASQPHGLVVTGLILTHATLESNVDFQWSQGTSDATGTVLERGSWISLTPETM